LIWVNLPVAAFEKVITSLWKLRVEQYLLTTSHDLVGFPILTLDLASHEPNAIIKDESDLFLGF